MIPSPAVEGREKQSLLKSLSLALAISPTYDKKQQQPKGYLQVKFFAKDSTLVSEEQLPLTIEAEEAWQQMRLSAKAQEDGYALVRVLSEGEGEVWTDDVSIVHEGAMIIQENHYDPWGMNLSGIEKQGLPDYKYQYNGMVEKQADVISKGYFYETDYRGYDPQLGRFRGIDILTEDMPSITPYQYAFNNPVMFNDPDGDSPVLVGALIGGVAGGVAGGIIAHQKGYDWWQGALIGAGIGAGVGAGVGFGIKQWGGSQVATWYKNSLTKSGELGPGLGSSVGGGSAGATPGAGGKLILPAPTVTNGTGAIELIASATPKLISDVLVTNSLANTLSSNSIQPMLDPATFNFVTEGNWRSVRVRGLQMDAQRVPLPRRYITFNIEIGVPVRVPSEGNRYYTLTDARNSAAWASGHAAMDVLSKPSLFYTPNSQATLSKMFAQRMQFYMNIQIPGSKVTNSFNTKFKTKQIKTVKPIYWNSGN